MLTHSCIYLCFCLTHLSYITLKKSSYQLNFSSSSFSYIFSSIKILWIQLLLPHLKLAVLIVGLIIVDIYIYWSGAIHIVMGKLTNSLKIRTVLPSWAAITCQYILFRFKLEIGKGKYSRWNFVVLILDRSYSENHRSYEFMTVGAMPCPGITFHSVPCFSVALVFLIVPESFRFDKDIQFNAVHPVFHSQNVKQLNSSPLTPARCKNEAYLTEVQRIPGQWYEYNI